MKISDDRTTQDIINHIKQVPNYKKVKPLDVKNHKNERLSEERVELSKKAIDLNKIRGVIQKTPDVREEKVNLLREKIASGNYNISGQEITDKMLKEFLLEDALKS